MIDVRVDSRTGIEIMEREECLRLLAGDSIGRLAVLDGDAPVVLPVNYAMDGEQIVVRTSDGTKRNAVHRSVCFEIDDFDRVDRSGWSVVVKGRLEEVESSEHRLRDELGALPDPWADGPKEHVLVIRPTHVSGRRVGRPG